MKLLSLRETLWLENENLAQPNSWFLIIGRRRSRQTTAISYGVAGVQ